MADRFSGQVIACWPADRQQIAALNRRLAPTEQFSPTVEHSLSVCDRCSRQVWIGRQQNELASSVFLQARKLCLFCAGEVQQTLNLNVVEVDLQRGSDPARRRTN